MYLAARGCCVVRHDGANHQSVRDTLEFLDRMWDGQYSARLSDEILAIGMARER